MAASLKQVEDFARESYPHGFESGLQEVKGRIFGYVRSDDFADKEYTERFREFRTRLVDRFGQHMVNVGVIVPLASGESLDRR